MSGGRNAVLLLARCGRTFLPTSMTSRRGVLHSRITSTAGFRSYSDQGDQSKQTDDSFEFPKLPVSPLKHFMQCAKSFRSFTVEAQKLELDVETVEQLNVATKEVLAFVTERLSDDDYDAVCDKFTPKCLEETRSMVSSLPADEKKLLPYDCSRSSLIDHLYPWACRGLSYDSKQSMEITFCALQILLNGIQIVWGISLLMPEHAGSTEDWKLSRLHFDVLRPS